jgi:elongation factor Ts
MITTEQIKELRDKTGISVMQCKKALEESGGDSEKALIILRKKGAESAAKKGDRTLGAGVIASYIHGAGSVGAMVELACETDFVSKNQEFKDLAYAIAMQVAATNPEFTSTSQIDENSKAKASEVFAEEVKGKPEELKAKILEGKLASYFKDRVLLEQTFIKNPDQTVNELINAAIQKFGEKVEVVRYVRYGLLEA